MFQVIKGNSQNITDISSEYYNILNKTNKNGSLNKHSLIQSLRDEVDKHVLSGDTQKINFYRFFLKKNCKNLKKIITGKPKRIQLFHSFFEKMVTDHRIPPIHEKIDGVVKSTKFGEEILTVFGYDNLRKNQKGVWLANQLSMTICPYCNLENAYDVDEEIFYQFDHFIPKVHAPYLSVSFYNLVPSCGTCNTQGKGTILYNISSNINPYTSDFHRLVTLVPNIDELIIDKDSKLKIEYKLKYPHKSRNKVDNYIQSFKLEKRYRRKKNLDEIRRLISVADKYPKTKKEEILKFNQGQLSKYVTEQDVINDILTVYNIPVDEKDASQMIIGKLKLDTAKQLKIL